jgi:hypothetical protein
MGILSNIFSKIFPRSHPAVAQAQPQVASPGSQQRAGAAAPQQQPTWPQPTGAGTLGQPQALQPVDVEAILNDKAKKAGETLNWRTSIVDLMKLLDLDSGLQSRKELAAELGYSGDMGDSAAMNIWLHKQVMNKLAANGGIVPADLKD